MALLLTLPGTIVLGYHGVLSGRAVWAVPAGTVALAILLFKIAVDSSKLLASVRGQLVSQARKTETQPPSAGVA
jgi:hypothetical protein